MKREREREREKEGGREVRRKIGEEKESKGYRNTERYSKWRKILEN